MATRAHDRIGSEGEVHRRGDAGYEQARRRAAWNDRKPARYPEIIVEASSWEDVPRAVRYARHTGLRVAIRSGGHSLCGAALRDGDMLIDLSRLHELTIDPIARTASVQPAVTGSTLVKALAEHDLAFPVGHCGSVAMGGYLLSGGFGWNMGAWGPACFSVRRMEIVTAAGELVEASPESNADLFWAARGAGSGFFGVVTRFELATYPLPRTIRKAIVLNPLSEVETVSRWAARVAPMLPETVEMFLFLASAPPGAPADPAGKAVGVAAVSFAGTDQEAVRSLAFLKTCPSPQGAIACAPTVPASFESLHELIGTFLPEGRRFAEDAIWCDESLPVLLPRLAEHVVRAPAPQSHILAPVMRPRPVEATMPDAAFSLVGRSLILCYGVWVDEADDARNERWHRDTVRSIERFTIGHYIAESDLLAEPNRAAKSFTPANWERLQALKKLYDPDGLFHTYLEA
jgi:FAD/FMN-containing dehydrogenase